MDGLRPHIVDVLGIVFAVPHLLGAGVLPGLEDDVVDIAAFADPGVLPRRGVDPVHHGGGHRLHAQDVLAAGFALDEPGQQLDLGKRHIIPPPATVYSGGGAACLTMGERSCRGPGAKALLCS